MSGDSSLRDRLRRGAAPVFDRTSERLDPIRRRAAGNDALLILGVMLGLYAGFTVVGLVLELDTTGIASTLRQLTFFTAVYAMLALALNLQWGYTGLFNIGVAGFMAVGVYTMGMLSGPVDPGAGTVPGLGLPLPVGIVGGMVAAALVGLVAALPALRLKADYLAIVTIGLAEIIRLTYNSNTFRTFTVAGVDLGTGGARGLGLPTNPVNALFYTDPGRPASPPTAFGEATFAFAETVGINRPTLVVDWAYALVLVAFVGLFYWLLVRVGNSPFGRVLKAVGEDELVANSLGKNTQLFKIKVFMLGCALMGLGGILWQGSQSTVSPASFLPVLTFYIFIALIIGGAGSNTGSVIGGALFAGLLFLGPMFVERVVSKVFQLGAPPNTFVDAVSPLASLDVAPLLAYAMGNINTLRFVLVGAVLVYLMQRRPEGLLGHRSEVAASVDLSRPSSGESGSASGGDGS